MINKIEKIKIVMKPAIKIHCETLNNEMNFKTVTKKKTTTTHTPPLSGNANSNPTILKCFCPLFLLEAISIVVIWRFSTPQRVYRMRLTTKSKQK